MIIICVNREKASLTADPTMAFISYSVKFIDIINKHVPLRKYKLKCCKKKFCDSELNSQISYQMQENLRFIQR